jgi:hypothetical protein
MRIAVVRDFILELLFDLFYALWAFLWLRSITNTRAAALLT